MAIILARMISYVSMIFMDVSSQQFNFNVLPP